MEYHQNGTLILSKWNTKWNTHQNGILIKMEHSYYLNAILIKNGTLIGAAVIELHSMPS